MTIIIAWLLADFLTGLVHWWEDRALLDHSRIAFLNGVRRDNDLHHRCPPHFLSLSWWQNINTTAPFAWIGSLGLWFAGVPPVICLAIFFAGFGNLVHRWSHEKRKQLPVLVRVAQKSGLFISQSHHNGHHFKRGKLVLRHESRIRYCVMTNWLNPILDYVRFWRFLELLLRIKR